MLMCILPLAVVCHLRFTFLLGCVWLLIFDVVLFLCVRCYEAGGFVLGRGGQDGGESKGCFEAC